MGNLRNLRNNMSPEQAGPVGSKNSSGFIAVGYYSGSGSTVIMPTTTSRFDSTNVINFGDRAVFFYKYNIPKRVTISGISIAYTANTATSKTITSITESAGTATATSTSHGFLAGDRILISGASPSVYNGTIVIQTVPTTDTFTFNVASGTGSASGTITGREFIGAAIYNSDPSTLLPRAKLADVASIPSTSNVITNLDSNLTIEAGTYWVGIGGSRHTNNNSLATFVCTSETATAINTNLYGIRTGHMSQFRGGIGFISRDNQVPYVTNGNSGFAPTITDIGSGGGTRGGIVIATDASAGNNLSSKIFMIGLVVV